MSPVDGPEEEEAAASGEDEEEAGNCAVACETSVFEVTVASVEPGEPDGRVGAPLFLALDTDAIGVDKALLTDCTTLGRGVAEAGGAALVTGVSDTMAEGRETASLVLGPDRNEDISPPMLDRMLPICLRCKWC